MNKIALIILRQSDKTVEKIINAFANVIIPEETEIEFLEVYNEERDIAKAFNEAMHFSKAKYKAYVGNSIENIHPNIIMNMLSIFQTNDRIGMIGTDGHNLILTNGGVSDKADSPEVDSFGNQLDMLSLNTGFIMTQHDVDWREELCESPYLAINSHCIEMKKKGFAVSTLRNDVTWYTAHSRDPLFNKQELDNYLN